ncbi:MULTISPECIES: DUF2750 domain-containing protein [Providencia]|uniref:DUF2750 domain-containing protein n=1 Tax=Providencia stuartii TaxID=588 RepID=A0ABD5LDP1_PROST|nr:MULTISPECIES: DUF2750 domain-containing protein [Providencia]ELR5045133.1 DUF2750 domain-containing protein [Providencia rettgeri]ELR5293182.1 DUF2750 domain-containing protein [Providencia stuartii]MCR4181667.1 DUF2750 domain-containing protein [Providencia vermicola]URE79279.1 DUF2750 domain-containing protein [Providencia stuartii]
MFSPNSKEIDNVLALNLQQKYRYFVGKIADWKAVWVLFAHDQITTIHDNNGRLLLPVWPAKAYAQRHLDGKKTNCIPTRLSLEHFMTEILPDMDGANMTVAIMMDPQCKTYVIAEPKTLLQDLIEECEQYE